MVTFQAEHLVARASRALRNGHLGGVFWITGLPAAGKSTMAMGTEQRLCNAGFHAFALDGDNVRRGLSTDLGFSPEDRAENIRRVSEVAALFAEAGLIVITAFISPYRSDRAQARKAAGEHFYEIYAKASIEACERRDPKGLYRRARRGEIAEFTGISAPYESPIAPDLVIDTETLSIENSIAVLVDYIERQVRVPPS